MTSPLKTLSSALVVMSELIKREVHGYAIGGLSGGEEKDSFWRMVALSAQALPKDKPRYTMGVGFALDLVVCSALGSDMHDCVYPTRTAVCQLVRSPSTFPSNCGQFGGFKN